MSNVQCSSCKQHKKQENFTSLTLQSEAPVCNACDLKMLQRRLEGFDRKIISLKQQQRVIKEVAKLSDKPVVKEKKQTSLGFLSNLLSNAH